MAFRKTAWNRERVDSQFALKLLVRWYKPSEPIVKLNLKKNKFPGVGKPPIPMEDEFLNEVCSLSKDTSPGKGYQDYFLKELPSLTKRKNDS
ncbi:MAG TPA: hypothetical protein V6C78_03250 [Crinalium sp.]